MEAHLSRGKRTAGFRSRLEERVAKILPEIVYETDTIRYIIPASTHRYVPDFKLAPDDYIEVKGRLLPSERKKHLLIKEQNPNIRIRFFFDKSGNKIYKNSPTTYAMWADKHGFEYTDTKRGLPKEWISEIN